MLYSFHVAKVSDFEYIPNDEFDSSSSMRPGVPVEPRRLMRTLLKGWKPIAKASLAGMVLGLAIFVFWPRIYVSTARLMFEGVPSLAQKNVTEKPYALIESATVPDNLKEVRIRAGLHEAPEKFERRFNVQIDGAGLYDTNTMVVQVRGESPEQAHALTAALVEVFLEKQKSINTQRITIAIEDVKSSLENATKRRDESQERNQAFLKRKGRGDVVAVHAQAASDAIKLKASADEQVVEANVQDARAKDLRRSLKEIPKQVLASATQGQAVDAPLAKAQAELSAAIATLSEEHPRVIALRGRVANLKAQKKSGSADVGTRTLTNNPARDFVQQSLVLARAARAAALRKEKSLRRLAESAQARAQELGPTAARGRQLRAEFEAAQTHAKESDARLTSLRDTKLTSPSGFRTVAQASMPTSPKRSTTRWTLLWLPALLAALFAALAAAFVELKGLRVQTATEVAWWGQGPVLGTSVWPRQENALVEFIDELEDQGVRGIGQTLVVPATAGERELAVAFAMKLAEAPWLAAAILDVNVGQRPVTGYSRANNPILTPSPQTALPHGAYPTTSPVPCMPRALPSAAAPITMRPIRDSRNTLDGVSASKRNTPVIYDKPLASSSSTKSVPLTSPRTPNVPSRPTSRTIVMGSVNSSPDEANDAILLARRSPLPPKMNDDDSNRQRNTPSIEGVAHASVRMVINADDLRLRTESGGNEDEALLFTRPTTVAGKSPNAPPVDPILVGQTFRVDRDGNGAVDMPVPNAVLQAAMRVLTDDRTTLESFEDEHRIGGSMHGRRAVVFGWNGPLVGPVLRRAARLAHRVIVVVPAGLGASELTKVRTRLGRNDGVGYVLVNLADEYAELQDRVGAVESFWLGERRIAGRHSSSYE